MLPGNPCGMPSHTSSRASTPAATARPIYRIVQQHFVVTDMNADGWHPGKVTVEGRSQWMFRVGVAFGGTDHGAHRGGDRCVFGIERMRYDEIRRYVVRSRFRHGQFLVELEWQKRLPRRPHRHRAAGFLRSPVSLQRSSRGISRAACSQPPQSCGPGRALRLARSRSAYESHHRRQSSWRRTETHP
jgi:hypothetical protein